MNCRRIQELIPLFVEDDLDSRRENMVSDHLKSCDICRLLVSEFTESQNWLKSYVPREFDAAYFEGIGKEVWAGIGETGKLSVRERIMGRFWGVRLPITAVALLVVVIGVAIVLLRSGAKDGLPNDRVVAADGAGNKPDVKSTHPVGPTVQVGPRRVAPARKMSGKTSRMVHQAGAAIARIIGPPNPIASGLDEPGEASSNSKEPDQLRIYIQTNDPNIRIIWLFPKSDAGD